MIVDGDRRLRSKSGARRRGVWAAALIVALNACVCMFEGACLPAKWGAPAILQPVRRPILEPPDLEHRGITFKNDGVVMHGWLIPSQTPRRGLLVYLHGIADNSRSGYGIARRFVKRGFDVLLYDSRAHGSSGGVFCTYGFHEKRDLMLAIDAMGAPEGTPVVVMGHSLGAAVALQAAAIDARIRGVIAVSSYSDLESIVRDRAPWFATRGDVTAALTLAEKRGEFVLAEVSATRAAKLVTVPTLIIHGEKDRATPPVHSRRIFAALSEPKELMIVPDGDHNHILARDDVWRAIEDWWRRWVDQADAIRNPPALIQGGQGS